MVAGVRFERRLLVMSQVSYLCSTPAILTGFYFKSEPASDYNERKQHNETQKKSWDLLGSGAGLEPATFSL